MTFEFAIALGALAIWSYLVFGHGGFWLGREREDGGLPARPDAARPDATSPEASGPWPNVVAVVPARNEADMIPRSLATLVAQDYHGAFSIVVVDDQSEDGTADAVRAVAGKSRRTVKVVMGAERPPGWTGKVWAQEQGIAAATALDPAARYFLLTDADIAFAPDALSRLVQRAEGGGRVLTSLMAKLRCESAAERALIPAFVYFFQMLYPFSRVRDPASRVAGAAGGCMLVERRAFARAGGIGAIRGALIDDCALAGIMKHEGPIWLGLTERVESLRPYPHVADIRAMVSRSAYAQLRYSPLLLAGTALGLILTYLAAPALAIFGAYPVNAVAAPAFLLMAISFQPTLKLYGRSPLWGLALPLIAAVYLAFTLDSAYQHGRGRGGMWKGRAQALPNTKPGTK